MTVAEAHQLLAAYTAALAVGDTAAIRRFWTERSSEREGFWYLHAWVGMRLEVSEWRDFLEQHDFAVLGVRPGPHYQAIDIEWLGKDSTAREPSGVKRMVYYAVVEGGRRLLENPIDVLTRDWLSQETECLRYRYPPTIDVAEHAAELREMNEECARAVRLFQLERLRKIEFYRARSPQECGSLLLFPPAYGYATRGYPYPGGVPRGFRVVVSQSFLHPHELIHLLHVEAGVPSTTVAFSEGLATALGGGAAFTAQYVLHESANLTSGTDRLPLRALLTMPDVDFFRRNYETYILAGGFFRFLLDRYGMAPLTQLAAATRSAEEYEQTIPQVYGVGIDELDASWRRYLGEVERPEVGFAIPGGTDVMFALADPDGDAVGDGDYAPPARYEDGVFDLTHFAVLRDSARIYFRLSFRHVAAPVTFGSERFSPSSVIAISRGAGGDHAQRSAHGVRFAADRGYDLALNVGTRVSLSDHFGRVYFTTPNVWDRLADERMKTLTVSFPIDVIGRPDSTWRYFVGVGLASERATNFIHGGPAPAYRQHPVFLSGGNYEDGNPAFIDILLPAGQDQAALLSDYDGAGRLALVPMLGR